MSSTPAPSVAGMWHDARIEALTRAWRDGLSASQIAARLGGGLTRSAVIGKLHRLGLCGGRKPSAPRAGVPPALPTPGVRAKPFSSPSILTWPAPLLDARVLSPPSGSPPAGPRPKYLRDMTARECRFGLGDPGFGNGAFQLFCAAPTTGHAYCAHHRAIAITPPRPLSEQKVIKAEIEALLTVVDVKSVVRRQGSVAP